MLTSLGLFWKKSKVQASDWREQLNMDKKQHARRIEEDVLFEYSHKRLRWHSALIQREVSPLFYTPSKRDQRSNASIIVNSRPLPRTALGLLEAVLSLFCIFPSHFPE